MKNHERKEQDSSPLLWNTQIDRIETWSFNDWKKPEKIGPLGQTYHDERDVNGSHVVLHIQRYNNSVQIVIFRLNSDGESRFLKILYRYNPTNNKNLDPKEYTHKIIQDPESSEFARELLTQAKI